MDKNRSSSLGSIILSSTFPVFRLLLSITAPLSCPEELLSYLFSSSWHNTALRILKKRFNLSRRSNKPWVSGKKTQHAFFSKKMHINHRPLFRDDFWDNKRPRFSPILADKLEVDVISQLIYLKMAGFLEAGGRFFSKENTWKGFCIAKGGKRKTRWEGRFNPQLWRNVVFWMPESTKQKQHFGKATESMEHTRKLKFHHFPLSLFLPHFSESNIHHFLPILGMYLLFGQRGFPTIQTKNIKATHFFLPRTCFLGYTMLSHLGKLICT